MSRGTGCLVLVLHAHLPFVRHPEHERFLEETWFFEAITETYVPLLRVFEGWSDDKLPARVAMTISPTLGCMLGDALLRQRYLRHLEALIELAEREVLRTTWLPEMNQVARFYLERLRDTRDWFLARPEGLLPEFRQLQNNGVLELVTCAATHAVLPFLFERHQPSLRAQLRVARQCHRAWFGGGPAGIWLPECAYTPGLDSFLAEQGLRWFITETHGIMNGAPRPRYGTFRPVITPSGVAAFGRDLASAKQVWSRNQGYPGDPRYREFHRDAGFELDFDYLRPAFASNDRVATGLKYHAVTGFEPKRIYCRKEALRAVSEHARHFVEQRVEQLGRASHLMQRTPVIVAPYDAELFGHWWYEGPEFLDALVRQACVAPAQLEMAAPSDFLREHPMHQAATPCQSSWGEGGHWAMWLSHENEWIQRELRVAERQMDAALAMSPVPDPLRTRILNQAARELLLAQASDWPFILRTGTSPEYARSRIRGHVQNLTRLCAELSKQSPDPVLLESLEGQNNVFPELHYSVFAG